MGRWVEGGVVGLAVVCALTPVDAQFVERWFSLGLYPPIQRLVTPVSNLIPFAVFDLLLVVALVALIATIVRAIRRARAERRWWPLAASAGHLLTTAAVVYLAFLTLWGWNYRRVPMMQRLAIEQRAPAPDAVIGLGMQAADWMNTLHAEAHSVGWPAEETASATLRAAFSTVQRLLIDAPPAEPGRLKRTLFGQYFRWASVDGMINPFALEVLANPDLLPFERPFVAAHEWSHLAGYADEAEANFVGWLTCLRGDAAAQYSGWLYLYWQVLTEVPRGDRARLTEALDDGPRADLDAIIERLRRGQLPLLRRASLAVYDRYLRANRVEEGIRSYGAVVTLILRARFENGWTPVRRGAAPQPSQ